MKTIILFICIFITCYKANGQSDSKKTSYWGGITETFFWQRDILFGIGGCGTLHASIGNQVIGVNLGGGRDFVLDNKIQTSELFYTDLTYGYLKSFHYGYWSLEGGLAYVSFFDKPEMTTFDSTRIKYIYHFEDRFKGLEFPVELSMLLSKRGYIGIGFGAWFLFGKYDFGGITFSIRFGNMPVLRK